MKYEEFSRDVIGARISINDLAQTDASLATSVHKDNMFSVEIGIRQLNRF